jgi:predicted flap endonuclease-1-like 5' DNA nuclease
MSWTTDNFEFDDARERASKALALPIGLSSPLWMAFGAAAGAGVAWWWATRWTRAVNLEAMAGAAKAQIDVAQAFVERESEMASEVVEAAEAVLAAAAIIEPTPDMAQVGDDLTRLAGVGPKLAAALTERGITTFAQIADLTEERLADLDADLGLKGRAARDEWVAQARRLAEEA